MARNHGCIMKRQAVDGWRGGSHRTIVAMPALADDVRHMQHAARLALRGHGGAEPNPLVGCVMVSPPPRSKVIGWGYHRRCGEAHAERIALDRAGVNARGATAYVTLEPCSHQGRTPPCAEALIAAGVRRVVIARRDPNALAAGGAERLRQAGITVEVIHCSQACAVSDPFVHRIQTGLPWVIAKWAQTIDGKIALREGRSPWISGERSRRMVHRERGRVDAILTGIGTVLTDDPLLTARHGRRRRVARRVVIDPQLRMPSQARLLQSTGQAPLTIACLDQSMAQQRERAESLRRGGAELIAIRAPHPGAPGELPLGELFRELVRRHDVTNVLVEAGTGVLSRLLDQQLVSEAWVFTAPTIWGDPRSIPAINGARAMDLGQAPRWRLIDLRSRDGDVVARYRITGA